MDDQSRMYELEFPAPQVSAGDGRGPVLVHGLEGFSDAGHAVKIATTHLRESLETELVASFSVDELIDYRSRRPTMTFKADHFSDYDQPELNLYALRDTAGTPFLLLAGLEPDLKWERFTTAVRLLAEQLGVRRTISLGAIPMAIPHTRPLGVTAHSTNKDLIGENQSWSGELQIPGSASALLELRMAQHGHESMGYSVHVPHYLAQTDYPAAAETLLENLGEIADLELPLAALGEAAARVREQVDAQITGNDEVQSVVSALERQYDSFVAAQERQSTLLAGEADLPSGDELGAEFEKFLAEQAGLDEKTDRDEPDL
ncbi:putative ATP-grasp superfamily ATP-dependent carboligase [Rhodococcus sp. PvR044]|jgi:predicted ATP-grasp superfamily ATP-dependent carboligase|uniref:proteasome assembly chaperone family protein n=1 Tax=Rhodococcus TaxID=1827 RepID=UPI000BDDB194|nr:MULTISPECIES: PAC2 family protein [Rhodococcus]MBP1158404.1 putative ATP-grasp superfamily ATP-dependent carboligase [Rhodococcus sp. PvR099]MCZ4554036.1 PAC2 family protein [Rhodococcus maanshanensis]PTR43830.1 proteasome assembly chaperone (PAC2) family protein [Rhodococcus sp. OK611]SNX90648.1 Proteasome assembly chaperone (PAC2) family protein [Rhodococcus sp. OK270]